MPFALWQRLTDEIAAVSPATIILPFWRGESLLHPEFNRMMDYALGRGLRIHMCTNGQVMSEQDLQTLLRLEFVTFSVHTAQGMASARRLVAARCGASPVIQVSFVDCEDTAHLGLSELISQENLGGFDSVRLYKEHTQGGVFGGADSAGKRTFCQKLCHTLVISADATVSRCNHLWRTNPSLSAQGSSIQELWASEPMQRLRREYPDADCAQCEQWSGHTQGERWQCVDGKIIHEAF